MNAAYWPPAILAGWVLYTAARSLYRQAARRIRDKAEQRRQYIAGTDAAPIDARDFQPGTDWNALVECRAIWDRGTAGHRNTREEPRT